MAVNGPLVESLLLSAAVEPLAADALKAPALATAIMPLPEGAIVTVEPALIVRVLCRISVAVRLVALLPLPTIVLPL